MKLTVLFKKISFSMMFVTTSFFGQVTFADSEYIIDFESCDSTAVRCGFLFEELLCDKDLTLTGLPEYKSYLWTNASGETIGTKEAVTITETGLYRLTATDETCSNIVEHWKVISCEWSISDTVKKSKERIFVNKIPEKGIAPKPSDKVTIYDASGNQVFHTDQNNFTIASLPEELYFAEITNKDQKQITYFLGDSAR